MGGIGSGPQKSLSTLVREAKENDAKNLPAYFDKLSGLALSGDREALFYLISWQIGKPKNTIDIKDIDKLSPSVVNQILVLVDTKDTYKLNVGETKQIEVSNAIQGQGDTIESTAGGDGEEA